MRNVCKVNITQKEITEKKIITELTTNKDKDF